MHKIWRLSLELWMKTCFLIAEKDDRPAVASLTSNFQLQTLYRTLHVRLQTFYRFLILNFRLSTDSSFSTSNFLLALYFPLQRFYRLPESSTSNRLTPSNNFHLQISRSRLVSQNVRFPAPGSLTVNQRNATTFSDMMAIFRSETSEFIGGWRPRTGRDPVRFDQVIGSVDCGVAVVDQTNRTRLRTPHV